jgi:PKD repeat protein
MRTAVSTRVVRWSYLMKPPRTVDSRLASSTITARRPFLRALATAGVFSAVGFPAVAGTVGAAIPGVTIDYKRCKVAFVSNASAIDAIAVYYADRDGDRQVRYDIAPTVTNPRGYAPLVVEYNPGRDRTQIQLAEPRGSLVCVVAEAGADRTVVTNPTAVCVPAGFNTAPAASFAVSESPTVGEEVTFTSSATDPDSPERLYYAWDLDGDGTFETGGETATATFATPGEKTISHRVTDDCGTTDTTAETITVVAGENEALFEQIAKLTADDGAAGDQFGIAVGIAGDTAIVGANVEDANGLDSGAAYVFERNRGGVGNWGEVAKLTASDGFEDDRFGGSVGIAGDTAIVGAIGDDDKGFAAGAAYVFGRDQGGPDNWGEVAKLTASDGGFGDAFGKSVGIAGDTAIVGADRDNDKGLNAGAAYVFERDQGGADIWGEVAKLTASDGINADQFGLSVGIAGDTAIVGAIGDDSDDGQVADAGAAYVFERNRGVQTTGVRWRNSPAVLGGAPNSGSRWESPVTPSSSERTERTRTDWTRVQRTYSSGIRVAQTTGVRWRNSPPVTAEPATLSVVLSGSLVTPLSSAQSWKTRTARLLAQRTYLGGTRVGQTSGARWRNSPPTTPQPATCSAPRSGLLVVPPSSGRSSETTRAQMAARRTFSSRETLDVRCQC